VVGLPAERRAAFERRNNCAQGTDPDAVLKDTQAEPDFLRDDGLVWISAPTAGELARQQRDEAAKAGRRKSGETTKRRVPPAPSAGSTSSCGAAGDPSERGRCGAPRARRKRLRDS
jgi:hypothetical protein